MDTNYLDELVTILSRYTNNVFRYKVDIEIDQVYIYPRSINYSKRTLEALSNVKDLFEKTLNKEIKRVQNQLILNLQDVIDLYTIFRIQNKIYV